MSKYNRQKRTFKAKVHEWPHGERGGVAHVYPASNSKTTKAALADRARFDANPQLKEYVRPYVRGEFAGTPMPPNMDISQITHVWVHRLGKDQQARVPLTAQSAEALISKRPDMLLPDDR